MIFIYENTSTRRKFKYAIIIPKLIGFHCIRIGDPKFIDYSEGGSYLRRMDFLINFSGDPTKSGIYSNEFWERWLLNHKKKISKAISYIEDTFEVTIISTI